MSLFYEEEFLGEEGINRVCAVDYLYNAIEKIGLTLMNFMVMPLNVPGRTTILNF